MLVFIGIMTVILSTALITGTAMATTRYIPLSMSKDDYLPPAMSWVKKDNTWIGNHWVAFNAIASVTSLIMGTIALFATPYGSAITSGRFNDPDITMCFLAVESACMLGFHAVWSTGLDWRYHKIPRWALVSHIIIQLAFTLTCCALSLNYSWMILSIVMCSIICWLIGVLPGSGMSDGRLYVIAASTCIPFMWTACWLPTVVAAAGAIVNAIIAAFTGGGITHAERNTKQSIGRRLVTAKSPMGPFVSISFTVFFMLYITQVLMV